MIDRCFAYDDTLKKNGNWVGGEGLQGPDSTVSLQYQNGKVSVTDGPYAETKEILGGLLIIEARDLNHAVQFPGARPGHPEAQNAPEPAREAQNGVDSRSGILQTPKPNPKGDVLLLDPKTKFLSLAFGHSQLHTKAQSAVATRAKHRWG